MAGNSKAQNVVQAIHAISAEIGVIGKEQQAHPDMGGWSFRGIEDALAAMQPLLVKHGVVIAPHVSHLDIKFGEKAVMTTVEVVYRFHHIGSEETMEVRTIGQGTDRQDKGASKAMSNAYKMMVWQTFCVPTEDVGETDSERHGEDPLPRSEPRQEERPRRRQREPRTAEKPAFRKPERASSQRSTGRSNGGYENITAPMAGKLMAVAYTTGEECNVHGFEVINHVLSAMELETYEPGSRSDVVKQHILEHVHPDRFDEALALIQEWEPDDSDRGDSKSASHDPDDLPVF